MADILVAATTEFAEKGFAGARIESIAAATCTRKFMIYYYFESKEGLYVAVLEEAYRKIRQLESGLHLTDLEPVAALGSLIGAAFDYHQAHPEFVRLVMAENMNNGEYLARSTLIRDLNQPVIETLRDVYARGVQAGAFRPDLDPVDIHMSISALCFHHVSNKPTFSLIFQSTPGSASSAAVRRDNVVDMVVRYVTSDLKQDADTAPAPKRRKKTG